MNQNLDSPGYLLWLPSMPSMPVFLTAPRQLRHLPLAVKQLTTYHLPTSNCCLQLFFSRNRVDTKKVKSKFEGKTIKGSVLWVITSQKLKITYSQSSKKAPTTFYLEIRFNTKNPTTKNLQHQYNSYYYYVGFLPHPRVRYVYL